MKKFTLLFVGVLFAAASFAQDYKNSIGIRLGESYYDVIGSAFKTFISQVKQKSQRKLFVNIGKYAAIALILVASTIWATLRLADNAAPTMNTLFVPAGQRAQITLQDGTQVWLNAQSTLTYPSHFSRKNREVKITGEAFFDVAKDRKKPFIVSTQNVHVKVLGTQFNVYSYPGAGYIQTDLVEG